MINYNSILLLEKIFSVPSVERSPYSTHSTEGYSVTVWIISITVAHVVGEQFDIGKVRSKHFIYSLLELKI